MNHIQSTDTIVKDLAANLNYIISGPFKQRWLVGIAMYYTLWSTFFIGVGAILLRILIEEFALRVPNIEFYWTDIFFVSLILLFVVPGLILLFKGIFQLRYMSHLPDRAEKLLKSGRLIKGEILEVQSWQEGKKISYKFLSEITSRPKYGSAVRSTDWSKKPGDAVDVLYLNRNTYALLD